MPLCADDEPAETSSPPKPTEEADGAAESEDSSQSPSAVDAVQAQRAAQALAEIAAEADDAQDDSATTQLSQAREDLRAALFALRTAQAEMERGLHAQAGESFLTAHMLVKQIDAELKPQLRRELAALDHRFVALARGMLESQYLDVEDASDQEADDAQDQGPEEVIVVPVDEEELSETAGEQTVRAPTDDDHAPREQDKETEEDAESEPSPADVLQSED
ncbi:MAG: hypothetical protein EA401_04505 [Planctomycetota bacterium]|nr:MAG: hypothetical protein EA401_04505 [Planctomycetota bacterium]